MKCNLVYKYIDEDVQQYWLTLELTSDIKNWSPEYKSWITKVHDVMVSEDFDEDDKNTESDIKTLPLLTLRLFRKDLNSVFKEAFEYFGNNSKDLENFEININEKIFSTQIDRNKFIDASLVKIAEWIEEDFEIFKNKITEE